MDAIVIYDFFPSNKTLSPLPIQEGSIIRVKKENEGWFMFKAKELVDENSIRKGYIKDPTTIQEIQVEDKNGNLVTIRYIKIKGFINENFIRILKENENYNPIADRDFKDFGEFLFISIKRILRGETIDQQVFIKKLLEFKDEQVYDEETKSFLESYFPLPDSLFERDNHILKYNKFILLFLIRIYTILRDVENFNFGWAVYSISENLPFKLEDNYLKPLINMDIISDSYNQFTFFWFIILENFDKSQEFVQKMFSNYSIQLYSELHERLFENITSDPQKFRNYFTSFLINYHNFDRLNDVMMDNGGLDIEDASNIMDNLSKVLIIYNNKQLQNQQNDKGNNEDNDNNNNNNNNNSIGNRNSHLNNEIKQLIEINLNEKSISLSLKCFLLSIPIFQDFQEYKVDLLYKLLNENQQSFLNVIQHYQKNQHLDIIKLVIKKTIDENKETKLFDIQFSSFTESYSKDISELFTVKSFRSLLDYLIKYNILNGYTHREVLEQLGRDYLERLNIITVEEFVEILQLSLLEQYSNFFEIVKFKFKNYYELKKQSNNIKNIKSFMDSIKNIPMYQLSNIKVYPAFNELLKRVNIFVVSDDTILHKEIERRLIVVKNMNYILQTFSHMFENQHSVYTKLVFRELSNVFCELKDLQQFHQNVISNKSSRKTLYNRMDEFRNWEDRITNSINQAIETINSENLDKELYKTKESSFNESDLDIFSNSFVESMRKCLENNSNGINNSNQEEYSQSIIVYILNSMNISYPSELITQDDNISLEMLNSTYPKKPIDNNVKTIIQFPNSIPLLFKSIQELFLYLHQSFIWYYQRKSQNQLFKVTYSNNNHGKISYLLKHNVSTVKNIYNQIYRMVTYFNFSRKQDKTFQDCLSVFTYFKPLFIKVDKIDNQLYQDILNKMEEIDFTIENGFGVLEKNKIFNYFIEKIETSQSGTKFGQFTDYLKNISDEISKKEKDQFYRLQVLYHNKKNNKNNNNDDDYYEYSSVNSKETKKDFINVYISEVMTLIMDLFISDPNFAKELILVNELWRILNNGNIESEHHIFDASVKSLGDFTQLLKENSHISSITTTETHNNKLEVGSFEKAATPYELQQSRKLVNQVLGKDYSIEPITDYDIGKDMLLLALAFNPNSYKIWYYLGRFLKHGSGEVFNNCRYSKKDFYNRAKTLLPVDVRDEIRKDIEDEIKECENYDSISIWNNERVCEWLNSNSVLKNYKNHFKDANGETLLNIYNHKKFKDFNLITVGSQKNFIYQMNIDLGVKRLNKTNSLPDESHLELEKDCSQISLDIHQRKFPVAIAFGFVQQEINGIAFLSLEEEDYIYLGITNEQQKQNLTNIIKSYYEPSNQVAN